MIDRNLDRQIVRSIDLKLDKYVVYVSQLDSHRERQTER